MYERPSAFTPPRLRPSPAIACATNLEADDAMLNWAGDLSVSGNTVTLRLASDASVSDSWIIADGLTGAATSYSLNIGSYAGTAALDTAISGTGTAYDGWMLTFADSTLKFAKVTA